MGLNIDKKKMDESWDNRKKSDEFYNYLYDIAKHQVIKKGIKYSDREDYIQFAIFKCFSHQESYSHSKGHAYSFFWKQISLAISYKLRKIKRRKNKATTIFVEQEKILDWADNIQQQKEGVSFKNIVDFKELELLKKSFKSYNSTHKSKTIKPNKKNAIKVIKWSLKKDPNFLDNFKTLGIIFKSWIKEKKKASR